MSKQERIAVLGVGNVLLGDDAFGPYTVRVLESLYELSEAVEVLDVGTPGLDFTPFLSGADAVIVIDTVKSDGPPGTIKMYRDDEIIQGPPLPRTNPHEPGLREALLATELTDCSPLEIVLIGVVPENTETGIGLSDAVRSAVPEVIKMVISELERLQINAKLRKTPLDSDIWWERDLEATAQ